ncbi:nuclease-related domain-containing protein [Sporolactobacillus sp. Y61]|uniref:Nuclease-related domain-containing protein n=1 Tax=Sporolactobacillus sp. Y61 TaxID=3160863 RepID=A0AAU8IIS1_9BACL
MKKPSDELPYHVRQLQALVDRFTGPAKKKEELQQQLNYYLTGHRGEREVDYHLSYMPRDDIAIIKNLRLNDGLHHFELDRIVITPGTLLMLEVKHISGIVKIHSKLHQMTRKTPTGELQRFSDPVTQAERHYKQLQEWFRYRKWPSVPVEKQIIFSSPNVILDVEDADENFFKNACLIERVPQRLTALTQKHPQQVFTRSQMIRMEKNLNDAHEKLVQNVFEVYHVLPNQIVTGVQCPKCERYGMIWKMGQWHCPICHHRSKTAHAEALKHYALLFKSTITNQECRAFLRIASESVTRKMLQKMNLPATGSTKGTLYHLPT